MASVPVRPEQPTAAVSALIPKPIRRTAGRVIARATQRGSHVKMESVFAPPVGRTAAAVAFLQVIRAVETTIV